MNMLPYSGIPALPKNIEDMHAQLVALGLNDVEALTARIKKCEDWVDAVEETELTGNPVVFQNALAVPAASLEATIEPIQPLHGYDHPWAGGAGKNLLPMTVVGIKAANTRGTWSGNAYTFNGVTFTINTDADGNVTGIKADGTPSVDSTAFYLPSITLASGNYKFNGSPDNNHYITAKNGNTWTELYDTGSGATLNLDSSSLITIVLAVRLAASGTATFYPMLCLSSVSDATFEPYTNICGISGRTETSVTTTNEDESESSSVTIQLGQTVYCGQVDFKTGKVTVSGYKYNLKDANWTHHNVNNKWFYSANVTDFKQYGTSTTKYANAISNGLKFYGSADWQTNNGSFSLYNQEGLGYRLFVNMDTCAGMTGAQFKQWLEDNDLYMVYELDTPIELTLTPAQLQMLKGYNSVSSDDASSLTVTAYTGGPWEPITRAIKKVTNKTKTTKKRRK